MIKESVTIVCRDRRADALALRLTAFGVRDVHRWSDGVRWRWAQIEMEWRSAPQTNRPLRPALVFVHAPESLESPTRRRQGQCIGVPRVVFGSESLPPQWQGAALLPEFSDESSVPLTDEQLEAIFEWVRKRGTPPKLAQSTDFIQDEIQAFGLALRCVALAPTKRRLLQAWAGTANLQDALQRLRRWWIPNVGPWPVELDTVLLDQEGNESNLAEVATSAWNQLARTLDKEFLPASETQLKSRAGDGPRKLRERKKRLMILGRSAARHMLAELIGCLPENSVHGNIGGTLGIEHAWTQADIRKLRLADVILVILPADLPSSRAIAIVHRLRGAVRFERNLIFLCANADAVDLLRAVPAFGDQSPQGMRMRGIAGQVVDSWSIEPDRLATQIMSARCLSHDVWMTMLSASKLSGIGQIIRNARASMEGVSNEACIQILSNALDHLNELDFKVLFRHPPEAARMQRLLAESADADGCATSLRTLDSIEQHFRKNELGIPI